MKTHLCQPGGGLGCGACCGVYNFKDRSREATAARLSARADAVRALGYGDPAALDAWGLARRESEREELLVPGLPTCPFAGDLGGGRVGCLLHPAVAGEDLRDLGAYRDRGICAAFECPSFTWLREDELAAILAAVDGSYRYGLAVTDVELLREILRHLTARRGAEVPAAALSRGGAALALREIVSWKERWPYRDMRGRFGTFAVDPAAEDGVRRADIDYAALGARPSRFDRLLLCLESRFETGAELSAAEALVEAALARLEAALP
jgi:hypothetical protein